jgi:predicted DCC family thiol-disulfide oxidoreductase YuxK
MEYLVAYDADCGPCTRFKEAIDFLDGHHRVEFISLLEADNRGLLNGVAPNRKYRSMHLISPQGDVWSGPSALPTLVRLLPNGYFLAKTITSVPGAMRFVSFVYSTFARLHDVGSCRYTLVAARASS